MTLRVKSCRRTVHAILPRSTRGRLHAPSLCIKPARQSHSPSGPGRLPRITTARVSAPSRSVDKMVAQLRRQCGVTRKPQPRSLTGHEKVTENPQHEAAGAAACGSPNGNAKCPRRFGDRGRVAERFKAAVLKTAVRATVPWVRIPPLPPELRPGRRDGRVAAPLRRCQKQSFATTKGLRFRRTRTGRTPQPAPSAGGLSAPDSSSR